jgi:hypothetical protein
MSWIRPALILSLLFSSLVLAGAAAAQEVPDDPRQNESKESSSRMQVDSNVWVESWRYDEDDQEFVIQFGAERPTTVTVAEMTAAKRGSAGQMSIQQVRVFPGGQTTIEIRAPRPGRGDPAGVSITTSESINKGYGVFLATDDRQTLPEANLGLGVGVGLVTMALGMGIAVHRIRNVEHRRLEEGWQS